MQKDACSPLGGALGPPPHEGVVSPEVRFALDVLRVVAREVMLLSGGSGSVCRGGSVPDTAECCSQSSSNLRSLRG